MRLPSLPYGDGRRRTQIVAFGSVNYSENFADGQWEETENVSCAEYPSLIPRAGRVIESQEDSATAIYVFDKIAKVVGGGFYWDGVYKGAVSPGAKQFAKVGDYIAIWPDRAYYNIETDQFTNESNLVIVPELRDGENKIRINEDTLYTLQTGYEYARTGNGETLSGRGQIILNTQILVSTRYSTTPVARYFDQSDVRVGNRYYPNSDDPNVADYYDILSIEKEDLEYWPGETRQYITVHFGNSYPGGGQTEKGTVGGWAYAAPGTYDIDIETYGGKYLNELVTGDEVATDNENHTYKLVEQIERTLYVDHYYYTSIQTGLYEGTPYEGTFNLGEELASAGITVGTSVTVSRGNKTYTNTLEWISNDGTRIRLKNIVLLRNWLENLANIPGIITIRKNIDSDADFDYICSSGDRLWGVKGNKIIASKKNDPTDFNADNQIDPYDPPDDIDDFYNDMAWETTISSDGEWTGITEYSGTVLCFKEDMLHVVMGSNAQNYIAYDYNVSGVKRECYKSFAIVNEVLYYYGIEGVYAYTGNTPQLISPNFGLREYTKAVGGTDGIRYYISAQRGEECDLHVYDTQKGIWIREDGLRVIDFVFYNSKLYALDSFGRFIRIGESSRRGLNEDNTAMQWHVKTKPFYDGTFNRKYNSKIIIRIELFIGANFTLWISYDGGVDEQIYQSPPVAGHKILVVPVMPKRCDAFRIRLDGEGNFILRGIAREFDEGTEK